jgi:hypothetical protein
MPDYTTLTTDEWRTLRHSIGAIVVSGAQIEGLLSLACQFVWPIVGANSAAKECPWKLSQRVDYLKRTLNGRFKDYHAEGGPLLTRVKAFKKIRDPIVHGYIADFDRSIPAVVFLRHELRDGKRADVYNRFAFATLTQAGTEGQRLALALVKFSQRFSEILPE